MTTGQTPLPGLLYENSSEPRRTYGAVFTRPWVVEFMLDMCGYSAARDLGRMVAVEPSCGDGAFLLPMIQRLSRSLMLRDRSLADAADAIRAYDLQAAHVQRCRMAVRDSLVGEGWCYDQAESAAQDWIRQGDYLLEETVPTGCDFVVGNPPYIRSEDIPGPLRTMYMRACGTMTPGSDIFVGFIEKALRSLGRGGVLSFICADRWMHNAYGRSLRRMVTQGYAVEAVLEMHDVDAFAEDVSAYPAIIQIRRSRQGSVIYGSAKAPFDGDAAQGLVAWASGGAEEAPSNASYWAARLPRWFHTDQPWPATSPKRLALLEDLEARLSPLEDQGTGTRVGIGIATGADRVFVVHDSEVVEADRLLPLVTTEHVRSGVLKWQNTWLVNPWRDDGSLVDLDGYPMLAGYFAAHRGNLTGRHISRKSASQAWFRTIDKVNPTLLARPKLLLQDMKAHIQPVYDPGHYYPHHNLYWIVSEAWDMKVLGGLLLSKVAELFVEAYGVKMRGRTLRFQAQYLRLIRVPDPISIGTMVAERLVRAFEARDARGATAAALEAYGLEALPD